MVSYTYLLTMLAATATFALPTPIISDEDSVEAPSGQVYICNGGADNNGIHYGDIQEDTAIKYYGRAKTSQGKSGYPKTFANQGELLKFPSVCNNTEVWELPVLASGKPFDITKKKSKKEQNHPGPMRVYYTKDLEFCTIGARMYQNDTGNPHNCDLKAKE